jgi:hypothetical protein
MEKTKSNNGKLCPKCGAEENYTFQGFTAVKTNAANTKSAAKNTA